MNMKLVKRIIAVTMAATLMVAPAITAGAATGDSQPTTQETVVNQDVKTQAQATVNGAVIKSDVAGAFSVGLAQSGTQISAVVPRESAATIKANAGLTGSEVPFVQAYDITAAKAPAAYASANAVAAATGGQVVGAINLKLAKKSGKTVTNLSAEVAVPMTFAIKGGIPAGKRAVIVKIVPGGAFTILEDMGTTPGAITVPVTGGDAAYFLMFI